MNNLLSERAVLSCGLLVLLLTSNARADVDVVFDGALVAEPCSISMDSSEQIVDFKSIPTKTFIDHTRTAPQHFYITLEDCDLSMSQSVSVRFLGSPDELHPDAFTVDGDAEGIVLILEDVEGNPVIPGQSATPIILTEETILAYDAYIQATDFSLVNEGEFNKTLTFSLEYE